MSDLDLHPQTDTSSEVPALKEIKVGMKVGCQMYRWGDFVASLS